MDDLIAALEAERAAAPDYGRLIYIRALDRAIEVVRSFAAPVGDESRWTREKLDRIIEGLPGYWLTRNHQIYLHEKRGMEMLRDAILAAPVREPPDDYNGERCEDCNKAYGAHGLVWRATDD